MSDKMYRSFMCLAFGALLFAGSVSAASLEAGIRDAQQLLEKGDADGALALLREVQVDYPGASEIRFAIGCANFVKGESLSQSGSREQGAAAYAEAVSQFDGLLHDKNEFIAREATYNRATTIAREALDMDPAADHAGAVAALRRAVEAYEGALERFPGHPGIKQNLEHVRLKLKELLQNTPPEQEQKQDQQKPPEEQPPAMISRFGSVATQIPGAQTRFENNTAILVPPKPGEAQP